jgi:MFS family permease
MAETSLTASQRRRSLAAAIGCTSVAGTAMGLTWPLLALILESQGVSSSLIGLSSASQSLAVFAAAPAAPRLILRFGMVRTLAGCVAVAVTALLLLPLYANVYAWFPIRFLLGASTMILFIGCETWVNQIAAEASRGRVIGIFGFLWSAGFVAGPLIIRITGIEGWTPFLAGVALIVIAALPLPLARDVAPAIKGRATGGILRFVRLAPAVLLAAPLLGAVDYINDSFLPLYAMHHGLSQASAVTLLAVLQAGVTLSHPPVGWLADRMDRRRLLLATTGVTLVLALALPGVVGHPWLLWPVVLIWGTAIGGIWTVAVVLLGERFRGSDLAGALAASSVLYGFGSVGGPSLAGFAMDAWDPLAIPLLIALVCLLYLPVTLVRERGHADGAEKV